MGQRGKSLIKFNLLFVTVPRENRPIVGALSGDGEGHLIPTTVRKERLPRSSQKLAQEAAKVVHDVDKVDCYTLNGGKFSFRQKFVVASPFLTTAAFLFNNFTMQVRN